MSPHPLVGKKAPEISLPDAKGGTFTFTPGTSGRPAVVFFYPKSGSYGCTKQVCQFRDALSEKEIYKTSHVEIVGISPDPAEKQKEFVAKQNVPYPILSDEKGEARKAYGVSRGLFGLTASSRVTFVIDAEGIVRDTLESTLNFAAHAKFVNNWLTESQKGNATSDNTSTTATPAAVATTTTTAPAPAPGAAPEVPKKNSTTVNGESKPAEPTPAAVPAKDKETPPLPATAATAPAPEVPEKETKSEEPKEEVTPAPAVPEKESKESTTPTAPAPAQEPKPRIVLASVVEETKEDLRLVPAAEDDAAKSAPIAEPSKTEAAGPVPAADLPPSPKFTVDASAKAKEEPTATTAAGVSEPTAEVPVESEVEVVTKAPGVEPEVGTQPGTSIAADAILNGSVNGHAKEGADEAEGDKKAVPAATPVVDQPTATAAASA